MLMVQFVEIALGKQYSSKLLNYSITISKPFLSIFIRVDPNLQDNINPVWCFLENVRDHNHPGSGCYSDTTWSSKDGRFWSSMACKGLPPIADFGIEELPVCTHYF